MKRLLTAVLLADLALYAIAGLFAYPIADDLMFIELAKHDNPLAQQYATWQGRYGYSVMMGVVLPVSPNIIVRIMPTVLIVLMVFILWKLLQRVSDSPLMAACGFVVAFLVSLPDWWQSVAWMGGSANYIAPLIIAGGIVLYITTRERNAV